MWLNFAKKCCHLFGSILFLLNFTGGLLSGKTHTADCCFVLGSHWYTQVLSPVRMSQTWDLPPSNFLSMRVHQSTLLCFCSLLRLWGTQEAQRFLTPRKSWRMRVRLPDKTFMTSCISAYVIFGSFLIRDSSLEMFSGVLVVAIQTQRSSSSNVLTPDMICLNHLKMVSLDRDWSPKLF